MGTCVQPGNGMVLYFLFSIKQRQCKYSISVSRNIIIKCWRILTQEKQPMLMSLWIIKLVSRSNMSFVNSRIDGKLALDDHTTFYIKKYPGYLQIKLDKDENSAEAYERIKSMCEGIKKVISQ